MGRGRWKAARLVMFRTAPATRVAYLSGPRRHGCAARAARRCSQANEWLAGAPVACHRVTPARTAVRSGASARDARCRVDALCGIWMTLGSASQSRPTVARRYPFPFRGQKQRPATTQRTPGTRPGRHPDTAHTRCASRVLPLTVAQDRHRRARAVGVSHPFVTVSTCAKPQPEIRASLLLVRKTCMPILFRAQDERHRHGTCEQRMSTCVWSRPQPHCAMHPSWNRSCYTSRCNRLRHVSARAHHSRTCLEIGNTT